MRCREAVREQGSAGLMLILAEQARHRHSRVRAAGSAPGPGNPPVRKPQVQEPRGRDNRDTTNTVKAMMTPAITIRAA